MIKISSLGVLASLVAATVVSTPTAAQPQQQRPNILVIFGDDIGIPQISASPGSSSANERLGHDSRAENGAVEMAKLVVVISDLLRRLETNAGVRLSFPGGAALPAR